MDYFEIKTSITEGSLAAVYLITGEEPYLMQELVSDLTRYFQASPGGLFNTENLAGDTPPNIIADLAQTPPLLGEKRLVLVRDFAGLRSSRASAGKTPLGSDGAETALLAYFQVPYPTTCLVFYSPAGVDKRKRFYKAIVKAGPHIEIKRLSLSALRTWAGRKARAMGLPIDPGAMELLLQRVGNDPGRIAIELEKLYTFLGVPSPRRRVTVERVRRLVPEKPEENIFKLCEALGEQRVNDALGIARDLFQAGEHPVLLLFLLLRQVRLLLSLQDFQAQGLRENTWASELNRLGIGGRNLPPGVVRELTRQARRFPPTELRRLYHRLAEADQAIKTGTAEAKMALELCLLTGVPEPKE
ncbi:MAG: DNA polymerase III subunit delta [Heliobacteriaceae bacterium]|nr:DNA polymerase III subunit delta [Heliobacteriaceae bacterium]